MKNKLQKCRFSNLKSITAIVFLTFAVFNTNQQMFAQFKDNFTDGDFVSDPLWIGSDSKFTVELAQLSLDAPPETGHAYLATASRSINDATWEFLIHLGFNPSTSNFTRVYLISDQPVLTGALNGYFVQLGNTADDVSLYRQDGMTITQIIDGADGKIDLGEVHIRIKVTRDSNGLWELYSEIGTSETYVFEGSVSDTQHNATAFFGVLCTYTSTRSDKFHFDDFSITGGAISDLVPPELTSINVLSSQLLQLTFSEDLEGNEAKNINNYHVDGIGNPSSARVENSRIVELTFEEKFADEVSHVLRVSGIGDKNGNVMSETERNFRIAASSGPAQFKDIILTEIFADPSPANSLPDAEFIEIFNRSLNTINLEAWSLRDATSTINLPRIDIEPGEYVIITSTPLLFQSGVKSLVVNDFPSLNNSGEQLLIEDASGKIIDSVRYALDWYKDDQKKEGGWSLELIDTENVCAEAENWIASEHPSGGTPGAQNSVFASKPDLVGPALLSVIPITPTSIRLIFNEKLQQEIPSSERFAIEPSVGVKNISFDRSHVVLVLELTAELSVGMAYRITVTSIADCSGNWISDSSNDFTFGLPEEPLPSDVLVNELLFDPRPGGVDFAEIVNVSKKFLNLKNWTIGNFENDTVTNALLISNNDVLLPPGGYLAFAEDIDVLKGDYPSSFEPNLVEVHTLPSFNDDAGSIAISSDNGLVLDFFIYSKSLHSIFINDPEGVSLERIALDIPTNEIQNWKSASTTSGYATPGYINSNSRDDPEWTNPVQIEPEAFIPIYGQPDFILIHYEFDHGGYVANVKVLDGQGHHVKQLANNEVLGTSGAYRWDGDKDDGTKARMGYYMVWFEIFDDTGQVKTFFRRVVVATRF